MRCLRPLHVYNQSRFLVPTNRDQLVLICNCGKCANCQRNKFAEWSFRAYKHFEKTVADGGYMLFDTLTYDDAHLPHLKDYDEFRDLPFLKDHSCFRRSDIKHFCARLRRRLQKKGFGSRCFDYFLTSEYGDDNVYRDHRGRLRRGTLRPHYHVLFYVKKPIPPLFFSECVGKVWKNGLTDGLPFKSSQYVLSNVFSSVTPLARRKVKYVSKYVMKHSGYSSMIYKRVMSVLYSRCGVDVDWLVTDEARRLRSRMLRLVDVFHNQSCHFGLSALDDVDELSLFHSGFFKLPNGKPTMFDRIPISSYYLRRICYDKVTLDDGYQCWSVKPDKKFLLDLRRSSIRSNLVKSYVADCLKFNLHLTRHEIDGLVDYSLNYKGRFIADGFDVLQLGDRIDKAKFFVYASLADKNHFGVRFVSNKYLGCKDAYLPLDGAVVFPLCEFVEQCTFNENSVPVFAGLDGKLSTVDAAVMSVSDAKQYQYDHLQSLRDRLSGLFG